MQLKNVIGGLWFDLETWKVQRSRCGWQEKEKPEIGRPDTFFHVS